MLIIMLITCSRTNMYFTYYSNWLEEKLRVGIRSGGNVKKN